MSDNGMTNGNCACAPTVALEHRGLGTVVLDAMFANIHLHIAVMDRDFTLLWVNDAYCRADGRPAEALVGRRHFDLYPHEENERIFRNVLNTGEAFSVDAKPFVYSHRPEGGTTYWDWTVSPYRGVTGRVDGLILTLVDVTEQEQRRQEAERAREALEQRVFERTAALERAVRELESFTYSVSHDLSTPLRAINGYASLLMEEFAPQLPGQAAEYLDRIRNASMRMDHLMVGLLQLNRVSRAELSRRDVDLTRLAHEIMGELQHNPPAREVTFLCKDDVHAHMDPDMARIVLANLLGNAWKFTGRKKNAEITFGNLCCCGETIYFVGDNGAGFNMAFADKLYRIFQRLHGSHEFPGSGIGLATVARIVRSHGGRIWAEAKESEGATFYFTLGTEAS